MNCFSSFSLKRYSLKKQFGILAAILISVCILLTGLITSSIKDLLLKKQLTYAISRAESFREELAYLYRRVNTLYEFIQFDTNLENLLLNPFSNSTSIYLNNINRLSLSLGMMNTELEDVAILGEGFSYSSLFNDATLQSFAKENKKGSATTSLGIHTTSFSTGDTTPYLVFGREVYGLHQSDSYGQKLGNLFLSINPAKASASIPTDTSAEPIYFMLIDRNFEIYPFNCEKEIASQLVNMPYLQGVFDQLDSNATANAIDTPNWLVITAYIPDMDYYFTSAIDKNALLSQLKETLFLALILLSAIMLFVIAAIRLLLANVLTPLNNLYLFVKKVGEGNMRKLKQPIFLEGSSEITTLSKEFNLMISEITSLNKKLFSTTTKMYELELEKKQAELMHLRSQINPHFLYNTLESMRGMALENDCPEIGEMCLSMGKIFRYSIKGSPKTTLLEEIQIIKSYLYIQLIRFKGRFDVLYHIPPNLETLYVPKMILQPLIENAIFHGLEPLTSPGLLYIGAALKEDKLHLIIQDDGVGIDSEVLSRLQSALDAARTKGQDTTTHIGLLNVHHRIQLDFGEAYGLSIESTPSIGTKITITLPIIEQGEKHAERYIN